LSDETKNAIPTIGFNVETVNPCNGLKLTIWDVGDQLKDIWRHYLEGTERLTLFVLLSVS